MRTGCDWSRDVKSWLFLMFTVSVFGLTVTFFFHRAVWCWSTVMLACPALPPSWLGIWCWGRSFHLMMHTARLSWRGHRFAQTPAFISSYRNTNPKGLKVCFLLLKLCDKIKIITGALMGSLCPVITSQTFYVGTIFFLLYNYTRQPFHFPGDSFQLLLMTLMLVTGWRVSYCVEQHC